MGSVCKGVNCARERKGREENRHSLVTSWVPALHEAPLISTAVLGKASNSHFTGEGDGSQRETLGA